MPKKKISAVSFFKIDDSLLKEASENENLNVCYERKLYRCERYGSETS